MPFFFLQHNNFCSFSYLYFSPILCYLDGVLHQCLIFLQLHSAAGVECYGLSSWENLEAFPHLAMCNLYFTDRLKYETVGTAVSTIKT